MNVPFLDLAAQHAEVAEEVARGWAEVIDATAFVGGPAVSAFERAYAAAFGSAHCVGVGNGTDALEMALRAVGLTEGDEAILPANSFVATAEAVVRIGAHPVFCDVDPDHLLIDPEDVARKAGPRTRAIIPVNLFGQVAPIEKLEPIARACGAVIVEDAAQSHGATRFGRYAGSIGRAASTSFYPGKNLGAAGDAGAVTTDDPQIARRVRLLAAHGSERKYVHETLGFNSRLDTLQAVVLHAKLMRLERWNAARRRAAEIYAELLDGLPGLRLPHSAEGNVDVWHLYVVRLGQRERIAAALQEAGISTGIHYPMPIHRTPAFAPFAGPEECHPVAESAAGEILSLPMFPHLTEAAQSRVADALKKALSSVRAPRRSVRAAAAQTPAGILAAQPAAGASGAHSPAAN